LPEPVEQDDHIPESSQELFDMNTNLLSLIHVGKSRFHISCQFTSICAAIFVKTSPVAAADFRVPLSWLPTHCTPVAQNTSAVSTSNTIVDGLHTSIFTWNLAENSFLA
jgi:hypothetical protein